MKKMLVFTVTALVIASMLFIPAVGGGTVSAKAGDSSSTNIQSDPCKTASAPFAQTQIGFRWQLATEMGAEASAISLEAVSALDQVGVKTTVKGNQLMMSGQDSVDQLRAALFDSASSWVNFLGGTVDMTVYLPANGTPVTLNLEARNTTGYRWEVINEDSALYVQNEDSIFSMRYQGYGAPTIQTIKLTPIGAGAATVHLVYRRPFEADASARTRLSIWMPSAANMELSDPTPAELQNYTANSDETSALAELLPKAVPASWDWRAKGIVPPIRDQGGCGSCWAFGTTGAMESVLKKSGGPLTDLSEQFLISCNKDGWGCAGGWDAHKYNYNTLGYSQTQVGAVLESAKPYTASNGTCATALNHPYKLTGWGYVGGLNSGNYWRTVPTYDQLKNAIYTYGPITVGVCVGSAFQSYSGGLFATDEKAVCNYGSYYSPNHLIVLVGWNDANQSLILRNSWNTGWGESGYMRIKYGTSLVGIAPTWVVRSASSPIPTLYTPSVTASTTKPTYVWSKVGATASYKLQVYDIAAATYKVNTTVSGSYCNATTSRCSYTPNVLLTNAKNYKWRAAAGAGAWSAFKNFAVSTSLKPKAGFWESATGDEFYVTANQNNVDNFAIYISACGYTWKITHTPLLPIASKHFSFSGSFYANGVFDTLTKAHGTDGLSAFYLPGCGYATGGPWAWTAVWKNSTQPASIAIEGDNVSVKVLPSLPGMDYLYHAVDVANP